MLGEIHTIISGIATKHADHTQIQHALNTLMPLTVESVVSKYGNATNEEAGVMFSTWGCS
jgi:hypothetical protein